MATKYKKIVFVHPDLGIGGAERLVIDAAVGLQSLGHKVTILTSYCNRTHCFDEARDGTLDVRVRGDALFPTSLAGRFSILFTILRQIALVFSSGIISSELREINPDVFFVDQLSICVPFFRILFPGAKILFYGHFPDRFLVKEETGFARRTIKQLYRVPFDALEGWSTNCSDSIVVNSKFTRSMFRKAFPIMRSRELKVVYPCVDTTASPSPPQGAEPLFPHRKLLLSINRFEHKKNLSLALQAFHLIPSSLRSNAVLILAGGHDERNAENASCLSTLQSLATSLSLSHQTLRGQEASSTLLSPPSKKEETEVYFLLSIPSQLKSLLLSRSSILLYTPENEHFGIVPLEAMLAGVPVLAANSGGPLETVYDGRTGWLRNPGKPEAWSEVLRKALIPSSEAGLVAMGRRGRERVLAEFGRGKMVEDLDGEIGRLVVGRGERTVVVSGFWGMVLGLVMVVLGGMVGGMVVGFVRVLSR